MESKLQKPLENTWLQEVDYSSEEEPETKKGSDQEVGAAIVSEMGPLYPHVSKAEIEQIVQENELNVEGIIQMLDDYHISSGDDKDEEEE